MRFQRTGNNISHSESECESVRRFNDSWKARGSELFRGCQGSGDRQAHLQENLRSGCSHF